MLLYSGSRWVRQVRSLSQVVHTTNNHKEQHRVSNWQLKGGKISPWRKDSVGMKKAAVHIPSSVINFRNQKLLRDFHGT